MDTTQKSFRLDALHLGQRHATTAGLRLHPRDNFHDNSMVHLAVADDCKHKPWYIYGQVHLPHSV